MSSLALRGSSSGSRFVQQQDFRIENEHRRQRDPLLLAARQSMRRAVLEMRDREFLERGVDALANFIFCPAELQRPEGELVEHGRTEELHVGVLKHQADAATEGEGGLVVLHPRFRQNFAEGRNLSAIGEMKPVQQQQQCRLARAVGAQQRNALSLLDRQAEALQGGRVLIGVMNVDDFERRGHRRLQRQGRPVMPAATAPPKRLRRSPPAPASRSASSGNRR